MKTEEIKNGEWYNVASLPEGAKEAGCPAEIGQRVQVLSTHAKTGGLIVAFPGWESLWDFRAENLEPLEQKLRRQIAAEVLQVWPDKKGIAAMIEAGGPEHYNKL